MKEELKTTILTGEAELAASRRVPPTVTARAEHIENCQYRFTIVAAKVTQGEQGNQNDVKDGTATFKIPAPPNSAVFSNFTLETNEGGDLNLDGEDKTWNFVALGHGGAPKSKTLIFTATYTGDGSSLTPLKGTHSGELLGNENYGPIAIDVTPLTPANACQPTPPTDPPCCEDCDGEPTPVSICPCEHKVFAEAVIATPKPSGRILSANISLINACGTKDVNVAVFLNELIPNPIIGMPPTEVPYAFKVIRMPALPCEGSTCCACETRTCHCVEFEINDDDTTKCMTRNFRIRTKATTVLSGTESTCPCECQGD